MITLIIWPNTLYENNELIESADKILIVEHPLFFTKYNYHKMKLVLHRSTMKYYYDYLGDNYTDKKIKYIDFYQYDQLDKTKSYICYDPVDHVIYREFKNMKYYPSKSFLMSKENLREYYKLHKNKNQRHSIFYNYHKSILLDKYPELSKYNKNYDKENRNKFPKDYIPPVNENKPVINSPYILEAVSYVMKHFSNNPGNPELIYKKIDFKYIRKLFSNFVKYKLQHFGDYQDSVRSDIIYGNHSILSPFMNIGMITPDYVLKSVLSGNNTFKRNNVEGYLRQIIGWREYCRYIYLYFRNKLNKNPMNHNKILNKDVWYNFNVPDNIDFIKVMLDKVNNYAYLHHIERLMYIGNFMLLYQIKPKEVFNWFQCMFLDSYHVFMYPNVYGMSQHTSDIMMSKVYLCSSNYIHNMSDYDRNEYIDKLYKKLISRINKKY